MKHLILAAMVLAAVACGSEAPVEEQVGEVEQSACSQIVCSFTNGGSQFMYAINYSTTIQCWYQNLSLVTKTKAPGCGTCCAVGYCPAQRIGQATYSQTWNCTAP